MISSSCCGAASLAGNFICRCAAELSSPGASALRATASRVGEISSAAQRGTEPAARVGAGVAEAPSGCQPVARRAARQRGTPGITQQAPEPPSVHAQREYRCPKGNIVFANGKNIVQAAGLNIVIPAAAMNKRGAFSGQRLSTTQSGLWELPAPFAGHRWGKDLIICRCAAE